MGVEYYVFALFIAGLVCGVAIVFKVLFAGVRRQKKLLDERESQILQLYTSVETLMEEFSDQVKMTTDEIHEYEFRAASPATAHMSAFDLPPELENKEKVLERLPRTLPLDANRIKVAGEVLERAGRIIKNENIVGSAENGAAVSREPERKDSGAVFQKFFDETTEATVPYGGSASEPGSTGSRRSVILALASEGKSDIEIASKLGITRNEVQLVIGLRG